MFAGHTDVVPPGDGEKWSHDPFDMFIDNDNLYGRGTADMKGSLAAMFIAVKRFINDYPQFTGTLGLLITSGEEGDHFNLGTPYVMEHLKKRNQLPQFCIVGEPSSQEKLADTIRIGRRGSLTELLK